MTFIKSDPTLAVGDFVVSSYHKGELIFKVTKITRRFLTSMDIRYTMYKGGNVGDEYTPLAMITSVASLSISIDPSKKLRKVSRELDASYLTKLNPDVLEKHLRRISNIMYELWP